MNVEDVDNVVGDNKSDLFGLRMEDAMEQCESNLMNVISTNKILI